MITPEIKNALAVRAYVEDLRTYEHIIWAWRNDDSLSARYASRSYHLIEEILLLADELRNRADDQNLPDHFD